MTGQYFTLGHDCFLPHPVQFIYHVIVDPILFRQRHSVSKSTYVKVVPMTVTARCKVAVRLLGLWLRIPPGTWIFVSCECCVLSEVHASGWSPVQRSSTEYGVSECDREAP